jgi:hypothetical protein
MATVDPFAVAPFATVAPVSPGVMSIQPLSTVSESRRTSVSEKLAMAEGASDRPVLEMVKDGVAAAWAGAPVSEIAVRNAKKPTRATRILDMMILTFRSHPMWLAYLNTRGNAIYSQERSKKKISASRRESGWAGRTAEQSCWNTEHNRVG